jgi:5-oxoprolinase (ATP-hydrolysing)
MTNSRLTDPEILEMRFPVVLEDFHIEKDSGGKGKWKAGDGTRRTIRFRERMDCAVLSSHRHVPPPGVDGGETGRLGKAEVRRKDGTLETLRSCDQTELQAGEAIIITTPTGGGYGASLRMSSRTLKAIRDRTLLASIATVILGLDPRIHLECLVNGSGGAA